MSLRKSEREALALAKDCLLKRKDLTVQGIGKRRHNYLAIRHVTSGTIRRVFFPSTPSCNRWIFHLRKDLRRVVAELDEVTT